MPTKFLHCVTFAALFLLLILAGCTQATPTAIPATPAEPTPTSTLVPTTAPTVVPTETAVVVDPEAVRTTLTDMLLSTLQVSVPVTSGVGIESAYALPLETTDESVLWLAHTTGIRSFEPEQAHVMAVYTLSDETWQEVARREFLPGETMDAPNFSPDYLGEESLAQVQIEPDHLWIQAEGGVGAHSGVYGLFSFDGAFFTEQVNGFSSSPGVGQLADVNNDGINEVLLDATDYYVFCYACGVRAVGWQIHYWDGTQMVPVELAELSEDAPAQVQEFNQTLLALVAAGLWKDAQAMLDGAAIFSYTSPTLQWNLAHVRVNATARQEVIAGESAYPLLGYVFYGDYTGAVEYMREYGADGLFIPDTDLITGTVAAGWETEVAERLSTNASAAIDQQPELAAAYFVRGWGEYIRDYDESAAVADVQKALELAPDDVLYQKSVEFLTE